MARSQRHRKGSALRKLLLVALVALAFYVVTHARAYLAEQQYLDTHTTAPAAPGR